MTEPNVHRDTNAPTCPHCDHVMTIDKMVAHKGDLFALASQEDDTVAASSPATAVDAVDDLLATMPKMKDRQPTESVLGGLDGYLDSDDDWCRDNYGAVDWLASNHREIRAALQASRQPQPQAQQGGGDCLTEIRDAISGYYLALDKREHGGIAQDRAFKKIEQALGMNWVQGAALATKDQRS